MVAVKEIPKGFRQTEVGIIPNDWKLKNILENSTMKARIGWQGLTVAEYLDNGDYFLITGTDFEDGRIKWETCHYVNKDRYKQDKNIQIKIGDILITKDGTIGKVAYVDRLPLNATLNSGVFVIRPKKNSYLSLFLFYIFNSFYFQDFLNKLIAGSTINHLYQKDFVSFNFPLPPTKAEQITIATTLNDADKLITELEKLIAKKKMIKQGVMQKLLRPEKGWEVKKLGDCLKQNPDYGINAASVLYDESLPVYLRISDITEDGKYSKKNIVSVKNIASSSFYLEKGDLVFARTGASVGKTYLYNSKDGKLVFAGFLIRVKTNPEILLSKYLHFYTQTNFYWNWIRTNSMRTGQPGINSNEYKELPINLPPKIEEQTHIVKTLFDMETEIESLEMKLYKYKMIKQGMMQNLLTGKIRLV